MEDNVVIELHYLGNIEYFLILKRFKNICFEIHESYSKQTFRNRSLVLSSQGIQSLIVPIKKQAMRSMKDTLIDNSLPWQDIHWKTIYSCYRKTPYFIHYEEIFFNFYTKKKFKFLIDLNKEFIVILQNILNINNNIYHTLFYQNSYGKSFLDLRNVINKNDYKFYKEREYYKGTTYTQAFGNSFIPNLSILDFLFSNGPYVPLN